MNPSRLLRAVRQDDARILLQIVSERGLVAPDLLRACEAIDSLDEILRRLPPRARAEIENLRACDAWFCPACQMSARSAGSAGPARCAECGSPLREQVAADALLPHRYQLLREVGQGGMSIVYEALDRRLRRRVAVKTLRQSNAVVLRREAQAVARLCHPNIVTVHEAVFEAANPFIVMDFVEGPSLAKALHTGAVSLPEALGLLETVARAVHYAHANQVIHRDLKPSNILLRSTGEPVITDFGLARVVDASRVTRKGEIAGTAPYMAPEQVNGDLRRIDGRTDVYALGVILYEMLAGRLPFDGDVGVVYGQILTKEPAPPRPGDADLSCICLKALSKDPADRYATAADFADDLRRAREGDPVRARPAPLALRLWKTARKHRRLSALSAAVGVLLATLVTGLVTAEIRASRERAQRIRELQDAARWRDAEALLEPVSRTLDEAEYAETPLNEDVVSRLRAELGRVYSRWPEFPPALLQEGRLYFLSGAWDAAQVPLDRAAQDARTAPAAHYTSGCLNIERYRSARAIPAFTCDSRGAWLQAQPFERESPQVEAWRQRDLRDLETYNRLLLARVQQS
ncbi:MAG: serine/threonine protein kinase, partial [Planctomycetes bacterium]|nr:serine/threonine protein kinase [Planctomycetota bacterium]